jgi:hypothetical protein
LKGINLMAIVEKNCYIIHQPKGSIISFYPSERYGVAYRIQRHREWSKKRLFLREPVESFAAVQSPSEGIYIFYVDTEGNIKVRGFGVRRYEDKNVYTAETGVEKAVYIEAISLEDKIHLFYTVKNELKNSTKILHQEIEGGLILGDVNIIGNTSYDYKLPFSVHLSKTGDLHVMYQRFTSMHCLGYKSLKKEGRLWTRFMEVDRSAEEYCDFSFSSANESIYCCYVKREDNIENLMYCSVRGINIDFCKLSAGEEIQASMIYIIEDNVWCSWIQGDSLCSNLTLADRILFNEKDYEEPLHNRGVVKAKFIPQDNSYHDELTFDSVFVSTGRSLKYLNVFNTLQFYAGDAGGINGFIRGYIYTLLKVLKEGEAIEQLQEIRENDLMEENSVVDEAAVREELQIEEMPKLLQKLESFKFFLSEEISVIRDAILERERRISVLEKELEDRDNIILSYSFEKENEEEKADE